MRNLFGPLRHLNPVVFDSEGGGGGGGGSKDNKSSNKPKATGNLAKGAPTKQLGSVSKHGQYAGDGFSWVSHGTNENGSEMLTRTYTGANKDAGLGQNAIVAGNDGNNNNKAKIAEISMKEGSPYAASPSSATDGDFLEFIKSGFKSFGASDSYAAQVGNTNYTPKPNYGFTGGSDDSGSFSDAFAAARAAGGGDKTFDYRGKSYTTDLAPETSVRPQLRPEPAVDFNAKLEAAGMADVSPLDLLAAPAPSDMIQPDAGAVQDYFTTGAGSPGFVSPVDYTKTASGSPFAAAAQLDFADRGNTFNDNERVTDNIGGIGSLPGYENTVMNFQNRVSTPGELEAQLAALDDGGVQVAQNATSYADYTAEDFLRDANLPNTGPPSMGFPSALQTKIMENDRLRAEAEAEYANDPGTGFTNLLGAGFKNAGELVLRGGEKSIDFFDPPDQYMFGDAGIGIPQLDSSGNVIAEIDPGFARALGADPNRIGEVAGTDNRVANYIGGVADDIQASKEQQLDFIEGTKFGEAKNRNIFGTGAYGPDPMALFSEIIYGAPTTAAIVGTSVLNPVAGMGLGATMTTGELTTEIENRMDSRIANGEFGPISKDQAAKLKNDYVRQITPYAAGLGVVEGATFGALNRIPGLKNKLGLAMAEGAISEGGVEPTLAESVLAGDGQNMVFTPTFDEEGAAVGASLGGLGGVMASPPGFNSNAVSSVREDGPNNSGVASDGTVTGPDGGPITDPSGNVLYGSILNPELSPTAGEIADSSVTTSYDNVLTPIEGQSYDLSGFAQGPIVTPRADNNTQIADQTNLLDTQAKSDGAALLSEMILDDASLEQSATTGNVVELASKLDLPMQDAVDVATEVSERAAREKADMLGLIASDEVSKSGSINEDTLAEINSMLSEEMAADVIEQANAGESLNGQTALDLFLENDINTATAKRQQAEAAARETANAQLLSSMSGIELAPMAPEVNNAPPSVLSEVSDQQAQENYAAIQAQEQAYTQTLTETGDAIAAEAAGNAAYENAVAPKLNTPEIDGSVTVDNVVPINDTVLSDSAEYLRSIIGDQANLSIDAKSQLGEGTVVENDLQTNFTEVEVPSETSAEIFDKFLQTGSDNIDIFRQVLNPDAEYAATVVKDAIAIADGTESNYESATAEELADVREDIYDKTQEFLSDQPNEMVVYRIGETPSGEVKSFTTNPNFKATLNLPWVEGEGNLQAYTVKKSDILGSPDITSRGPIGENEVLINVDSVTSTALDTRRPDMIDVLPDASTEVNLAGTEVVIPENTDIANPPEGITISIEDEVPGMKTVEEVPKLLTDETVNNVAAEVPVENVTNTTNNPFVPYNTAYVPPEDDNDNPVTPTFTETDDGVTVGLPVDTGGGTVAPALGVNVAGNPVMECPEGYELVDAPNGPTCVKIEESYRLRAGAGTRPYTGQTIRPGDTGPGQRRQQYDKRTYTAATPR
tara:strand:- start:7498 stop:11871 length:4374 start_codon:yes stop_codon:yes gene_type:complete